MSNYTSFQEQHRNKRNFSDLVFSDLVSHLSTFSNWVSPPCKAEQPLKGIDLQEKEEKDKKAFRKSV